jgi:hypothetical protein
LIANCREFALINVERSGRNDAFLLSKFVELASNSQAITARHL